MTITHAKESHPLASIVLSQLGGGKDAIQSAIDAANHGGNSGFSGFTYSAEMQTWFRRNKTAIRAALKSMADDLGEDTVSMIRGFGCLTDNRKPHTASLNDRSTVTAEEVGSVLWGDGSDAGDMQNMIVDALCWFALEEVGRALDNA